MARAAKTLLRASWREYAYGLADGEGRAAGASTGTDRAWTAAFEVQPIAHRSNHREPMAKAGREEESAMPQPKAFAHAGIPLALTSSDVNTAAATIAAKQDRHHHRSPSPTASSAATRNRVTIEA